MANFSFGGVVYRSMVHVGHVQSAIGLTALNYGVMKGPCMTALDYLHSSNLPQGRSIWLRRQIANRQLEWAVSADSDSKFSAEELTRAIELVHGKRAIGIVPMVRGGTELLNVNSQYGIISPRELSSMFAGAAVCEVHSGGFGVAVFNLKWFRSHWQSPAPEMSSLVDPIHQGEDIQMCHSVMSRGGTVVALAVTATHMDCVQTEGRTVSYENGNCIIR